MIAAVLLLLALASAAVWIGLIALRGGFWLSSVRDEPYAGPAPAQWPPVVAVVPARNEADVVAHALGSLLAQDYPGQLRVVLVDDVYTSGATTDACTRVLLRGGAKSVTILCWARVLGEGAAD